MRVIEKKKRKVSAEPIISSGKSQIQSLQSNVYLHNLPENYELIGQADAFSPVDVSIMDQICAEILKKQKAREKRIYKALGVVDENELNQLLLPYENKNLIDITATELLNKACDHAFENFETTTRNKKTEQSLELVVNDVLYEILQAKTEEDKQKYQTLVDGLGTKIVGMLKQSAQAKKKPRIMSKYIAQVSEQITSRFRGDILEESLNYAIATYAKEIKKMPNVSISATDLNDYGKQIKSDVTWQINEKIKIGFSAKNYSMPNGQDVTFTLHSEGFLENFYKLASEMNMSGISGYRIIASLIKEFRSDNFRYHLVNQAAMHGNKLINSTPAGNNVMSFIKRFLPLFIGAQFKIKGDSINVDFFNINGYFVPVSTIIEDAFYGGKYTGLKIGLYSNYTVPWMSMLKKKLSYPVENNEYYSDGTEGIGGEQGALVYKNIKTGRVHLKVALSNLKTRG